MNVKRILSLMLTICIMLTLMTFPTMAATSGDCGANVTWTLDDQGTLTISGTGAMREYASESSVPWYSNRSSIKTVVIEDGVTSIGEFAFANCDSLISVTIGDSVAEIGDYAFFNCYSLTSITIPDSVTSIGEYAFKYCSKLTSFTIPDSVTLIGSGAFSSCNSLTEINVDEDNQNFSSIDGVLFDKDKITLIQYPATKTATSYTIPNSVTSIGDYAFEDCTSLTSVTIPDSVTSIGSWAFGDCTSLTSITISNSVTSIGGYAFYDCYSLTSVVIPNSVTTIGMYAFFYCSSLTSVTIPDSVTSISSDAFSDCTSLTAINVDSNNPNYSSIDGVLFNKDKTTLITCPEGKSGTYTIPDGVTSIGRSAFSECTSLTSVTIGDSVTSIGNYAFYGCTSLTSVTIPDSVTSIGEYAFYYCTSLASITIPDSVTSIGEEAFSWCTSLTAINVDSNNPNYSSIDGVLFNKDKTTLITCPEGKSGTYTIPDSVTSIGSDVFSGCYSLTSVTIPDSVTSIGSGAFCYCYFLTAINVDSNNPNYSSIDGVLFDKNQTTLIACPRGKSGAYTTPDSVTSIGELAFYACDYLTSVTIPDSVTSIGEYAFEYCSSLANVYYKGTETQRNSIFIEEYNDCFVNATWYYNFCGEGNHTYDNFCDTSCNVCGDIRTVGDHVYDNDCDTNCNVCGASRVTEHRYDNNCDAFCNVCGYTRTVAGHTYDNIYDASCNICGYIREVADPNAPTFVVENKTARVGNSFTVAITTKNNIGIVSLKLMLGYDANLLELVSIEEVDFEATSFGPLTNNPIAINWEDVLNPNNTTNGTVALVTFKVKETATECDTSITITYDPEDVYDENFDNVAFAVEAGTVTIIEYTPGDVNSDGTVNNKDLGMLRQYLNGWGTTIDLRAADVTGDGKVNNKDLGILRQYLNGWDVTLKSGMVDSSVINVAKIDISKIQALYQRNNDTIGWIKIPNTNIDCGVVKENYPGEYMKLDYDKNYIADGEAIWADAWNTFGTRDQLSKNTIIYGHNWTNYKRPIQIGRDSDKHFSQLAAYDYIDFARANPYISFSTLEEEMYWQIFAVFYVEVPDNYTGSNDYYYINDNPTSLVEFTNEAMERSMFDFGVTITESDKILTLSTQTRVYNEQAVAAGRRKDQQRFVVMAKLMPKGATFPSVNVTENEDFKPPQF